MSKNFDHGVAYTPETVAAQYQGDKDVEELLHGSRFVRVYWLDLANILRVRIFPTPYFLSLLSSNRPGTGIAIAGLGLVFLSVAPGFPPMGEYLYVPDMQTMRSCAGWAPEGHVAVLGHFEEKIPRANGEVQVGMCPRTLLKRVVAAAKAKDIQAEFLVGFESEFILLSATSPEPVASNSHQWCDAAGFTAGSRETAVLDDVASALAAAGIELQLYHAEAAPGQYEVVTGPLAPVEAADALILTREIIYQCSAKHGLKATFAPRPFLNSTGSSCHTHISVHSALEPAKPKNGMGDAEQRFLAGLLAHLPAIAAVTLPTPASYKRMVDGAWSGGTYVSWGSENRESPIRLANHSSPSSRNFEVRCVDATSNPHLALAAIIAGGLDGLRDKGRQLTVKDCPGPRSAAQLSEEERAALGITRRLPLSIGEARTRFEEDTMLVETLGKEFAERYLNVNRTLETAMKDENGEEAELVKLVQMY